MVKFSAFALLGVVALAACAPSDGAFVQAPKLEPANTVRYPGGTTTGAIATQLTQLGFSIEEITPTTVMASTTQPGFVDCGTFIQYRDGNRSEFSGTTPLSVIYTDSDSNDFFSREVAVTTRVAVQLNGTTAVLAEKHDVAMQWIYYDGSGSSRQSGTVSNGAAPIKFFDGTICGVDGRIADALG